MGTTDKSIEWAVLHQHSMFSLLDGVSKPSQIVKRCKELGYTSAAITDHGNIGVSFKFADAMHKAGIKPILGCELYVTEHDTTIKNEETRQLSHLPVLAKNLQGWKNLIKISSHSFHKDNFYYHPRINIDRLAEMAGEQLIVFAGHPGSHLANVIFNNPKAAYSCRDRQEIIDKYVYPKPEWCHRLCREIAKYRERFGKDNFFVEIQIIDPDINPACLILAEALRWAAKKEGVMCIATGDSHYPTHEQAADQRILLCSSLKTTEKDIQRKIANNEDFHFRSNFMRDNYHIPSIEELLVHHTAEEINNAAYVASLCEDYKIGHAPILPEFPCPDNLNSDQYLKKLCVNNWQAKVYDRVDESKWETYRQRISSELSVFKDVGLAPYFLIVQDYCNWATNNGIMRGPGRGCLAPNVPIIMGDGKFKSISDIDIGDKVICKDGLAHEVEKIFQYDIDEELLNIHSFYGDDKGVTLTKDHHIYAEKAVLSKAYINASTVRKKKIRKFQEPTGDLRWYRADELKAGDWVFTPTPDNDKEDYAIDLADYCTTSNTRFDDSYVYHEKHNPLTNTIDFVRVLPRKIILDEWWMKLFGNFAGNGWFRKKDKWDCQFGIAFNGNHKDKIDYLVEGLERRNIDFSISYSKNDNLYQILIRNRVLLNFIKSLFNNYQSKSNTKHVPELIFRLSSNNIISFLKGYFETDGYFDSHKNIATTVSKNLAYGIHELCRIVGIPCSIRRQVREEIRPEWGLGIKKSYYMTVPSIDGLTNNRTAYNYRKVKGGFITKIRKITASKKFNKVYDIKVKEEHNYLTSSFIVHNSVGGSLAAYLIGITDVDPIRFDLQFERFYNAGRNEPGKISLPDIDCDFEVARRREVIDYIKYKYGSDKVANIATFNSLKGRAALTEVLRAHNVPFDEVKRITADIPDEASISDQLQEMKNRGDEPSIIRYALENDPQLFEQWCSINDDGKCDGVYGGYFEQAMRLEGTKRNISMHAAGVVISSRPLNELCPLIYDSNLDGYIAGMEYPDLELMGLVKLDILGVAALSKIRGAINLLRHGTVEISNS